MSSEIDQIKLVKDLDTGELIPEIWKDVPGYEGWYEASNYGRILSWKTNNQGRALKPKILKQCKDTNKYLVVNLSSGDGRQKVHRVHKIISKLFVGRVKGKNIINHKDGDKCNNFYKNLERSTHSLNNKHAYDTGLKVSVKGERNGRAKLTRVQVLEIRELKGKYTCIELGRMFGVADSTICNVHTRKIWRHI